MIGQVDETNKQKNGLQPFFKNSDLKNHQGFSLFLIHVTFIANISFCAERAQTPRSTT